MKENRSFFERFKVWFALAAVEFGIVCGGAMASGSYAVSYFASAGGGHMLVFLLIWGIFFFVAAGLELNFSRAYQLYDYNAFYLKLWGADSPKASPVYKGIVTGVFDIYSIATYLVGNAACIALGGTVFHVVFGWPIMLGNILMGIVFTVLMIKGAGFLRKASSFMTIVLVLGVVAVLIAVISEQGSVIGERLGNFAVGADWKGDGLGSRYWAIISYSGTTFNGAVMLVNCAQNIKTKKDAWMTAVLGALLCILCFGATALIVLPYLPAEITNAAPILTICSQYLSSKIFFYIYWVIMFFALASSGPPITFSIANRCLKFWKSEKLSQETKLAILGVIVQICSIALSAFGLMALVAKGLSLSGQATLLIVMGPVVFTTPFRTRKRDLELAQAKDTAATGE